MKTKFISIAATILLAASFNTAFAERTVYNSSLNVNGTWYNCSSTNDWCSGGQFNGQNLGVLTELKIGGKAYSWNDGKDWHGGVIYLGYKIDGGETKSLAMSYIGWDGSTNGMIFQSGGEPFVSSTITEFSNLTGGVHRIEIWFYNTDPDTGESGYDSNNSNNYVATFTINKTIELGNNDENNSNIIARNNGYTGDVQLTGRTLVGGQWNTICLPFDLAVSGSIFTDVKTLQSSLYNNGTLTLNFSENSETTIVAGKPYLVKVNSDIANPTFTDVAISTTTPGQVGSAPATFKGNFNPIEYTEENTSILYLGAGNKLYYPSPTGENPVTIGAFRAYFELDLPSGQQAKSFVLNFGDDNEETSIKQINNTESATNTYFTLDGRRLNEKPATAGLYIINGKKVVIK